jgi:hypothetical protein
MQHTAFEYILDYQKISAIICGCPLIAATHHSAIFNISSRNPNAVSSDPSEEGARNLQT